MYQLHVISASYENKQAFESALRYALSRIEPLLHDLQLWCTLNDNIITIQGGDSRTLITAKEKAEFKHRITGCFCDDEGFYYREFAGLCWNK